MPLPSSFFSGSSPVALVAGGAGFIGSHFCRRLLERKVKVICVDNWQTGFYKNVSDFVHHSNFFLLEDDITGLLPKQIERVDYIIHLAGIEAYLNGEDVTIETLEANSVGTRNLLDLARQFGAKFLLASSVDVYSARVSASSATSYFGGGQPDEGFFAHHEAKRFAEALVSEYVQKEFCDGRIVRLGDVYGPGMMLSTGGPLARLVKSCLYNTPVEMSGERTTVVYPVFIDDVVDGLAKSLFSSGTRGKIISLAGDSTSLTSVVQTVKGILPQVQIQFSSRHLPERAELGVEVINAGRQIISWQPVTSLTEGLTKTLDWFFHHKAQILAPQREKAARKSDVKLARKTADNFWLDASQKTAKTPGRFTPTRFFLLLPSLVVAGLLFWFFAFPLLELGIGSANLYLAIKKMALQDQQKTEKWGSISVFWLDKAQKGFSRWENIPGLKNEAAYLLDKSQVLARTAAITQKIAAAAARGKQVIASITGDQSFAVDQAAGDLGTELSSLERELAFLEAEVGSAEQANKLPFLGKNIDPTLLRQNILTLLEILPNLPELLGQERSKTYLMLFQDNRELRPAGGVTVAFGLLTFEKGRLVNVDVRPVEVADGQLRGHVEPPKPLKEYGQQQSWYLRDAGWSGDFPTTAQRAVWFIDKALGQKIDGTIAIDYEFVKKLLGIYGPVTVGQQQVSAKNLYQQIQKETTDAEGKTAAVILGQLLSLVAEQPKEKAVLAAKEILPLFGKHVVFTTDNKKTSNVLGRAGWDGASRSINCPTLTEEMACITDYVYPLDANIGKNHANYFLQHSYSLDVSLEERTLIHKLLVTYELRADAPVYKNYFRVLVPRTADNFYAFLLDPGGGEQEELAISQENEGAKKSAGVFFSIPSGQTRQLVVGWGVALGEEPAIEKNGQLMLLWQKQIGTSESPAWVKFGLPDGYRLSASPSPSLTGDSYVGYNTVLSKDLLLAITWQKQ